MGNTKDAAKTRDLGGRQQQQQQQLQQQVVEMASQLATKFGAALRQTALKSHAFKYGAAATAVAAVRAYGESAYLAKEEVTERVLQVVKNFQKVDPAKVTTESHFVNDLGLDSLDTVEVVMAFEDEFALEIPDKEADKIASCSEAIEYIAAHPAAK